MRVCRYPGQKLTLSNLSTQHFFFFIYPSILACDEEVGNSAKYRQTRQGVKISPTCDQACAKNDLPGLLPSIKHVASGRQGIREKDEHLAWP